MGEQSGNGGWEGVALGGGKGMPRVYIWAAGRRLQARVIALIVPGTPALGWYLARAPVRFFAGQHAFNPDFVVSLVPLCLSGRVAQPEGNPPRSRALRFPLITLFRVISSL